MKRYFIATTTSTLCCMFFLFASEAHSTFISASLNVTALTDANQLGHEVGVGRFNEGPIAVGPADGIVDPNVYANQHMTIHGGPGTAGIDFSNILPGIVSTGVATLPRYRFDLVRTNPPLFPQPIDGGGINHSFNGSGGLVVTFSRTINQFGLTLSRNGTQYITAYRADGTIIGDVTWSPSFGSNVASFVGIDTGNTPIAMLVVGNDDLLAGQTHDSAGTSTIYDHAIWATTIPEPATVIIALCGMLLATTARRRHA